MDFNSFLENQYASLISIPTNDILVDCALSNHFLYQIEHFPSDSHQFTSDPSWKRILTQHFASIQFSQAPTLCCSTLQLSWLINGNQQVTTPIVLVPLVARWINRKQQFQLIPDIEAIFLNPFFIKIMGELGCVITEYTDESAVRDMVDSFFEDGSSHKWIENIIVGNFHHHRFSLMKEVECLLKEEPSLLIKQLCGELDQEIQPIEITSQFVLPLDPDQAAVINSFSKENLIVQGPPGTGKSLMIVNLLATFIYDSTSHLVISEKSTALAVIYSKMKSLGLAQFVFLGKHGCKTRDLINSLRLTWEILDKDHVVPRAILNLSNDKKFKLQSILDKLNASDILGGLSYTRLKAISKDKVFSGKELIYPTVQFSEWFSLSPNLSVFYENKEASIPFQYIKQSFFKTDYLLFLGNFLPKIRIARQLFNCTTISQLTHHQRISSLVQLVENERNKPYFTLLFTEKSILKFQRLCRDYYRLRDQLQYDDFPFWPIKPSLLQVNEWMDCITNAVWWKRNRLLKRLSKELIVEKDSVLKLLGITKKHLLHHVKLNQLTQQLHMLGIHSPNQEIPLIQFLIEQISKESTSLISIVLDFPESERLTYLNLGSLFSDLHRAIDTHFHFPINDFDFSLFFEKLDNHKDTFIFVNPLLNSLTSFWYQCLVDHLDYKSLELSIIKSAWTRLETLLPELENYNGSILSELATEISTLSSEEQILFADHIRYNQARKFFDFHQLILSSTSKLNEVQKTLKKRLQFGKRILAAEFSKTRHSLSIRQLLDSDARLWIDLLHPTWLLTPHQLASFFPLSSNQVDVVIFDEASQIPFVNSLGALQRAKRIMICGDSQQMSPMYYFSSKGDQIDLLQQATYYLPTVVLKHHYRSQHPALFQFSNRYFYSNSLIAFPSYFVQDNPIETIYLPSARFLDRVNKEEAIQVAKQVDTYRLKNRSLGVVAFSQSQLDEIWNALSIPSQEFIINQQLTGIGFFKSLEHVQGEECDVLIISIGYARNSADKFQLRMGPLNRINGHRRLNVLFSRAKHKMIIVTSLRSTDFRHSSNESIHLLRLFLSSLETPIPTESFFPFGLKPFISDHNLTFISIHESIKNVDEFVLFHRVLIDRGWKLNFM